MKTMQYYLGLHLKGIVFLIADVFRKVVKDILKIKDYVQVSI